LTTSFSGVTISSWKDSAINQLLAVSSQPLAQPTAPAKMGRLKANG
jgi:hypothetical protein